MNTFDKKVLHFVPAVAIALLAHPTAWADVITDWNVAAADIAFAAGMPPPPANRTLAIVQTPSMKPSMPLPSGIPPTA